MTVTVMKKARQTAERQACAIIIAAVVIGLFFGGFVGAAIKANALEKSAALAQPTDPYGTRDGKTLTDEGLIIVESEEFVPIECALPEDLQEYTYYICQAYYIDFDFAMALMFAESSFKADVVSSTNDYGLMQINACNHAELEDKLGITDIMEPHQNIRAGLYLLRGLFEKYDDAARVCMAYSLGEYGASVLWEQGVYSTNYSNKILAKANEYAAQRRVTNE